MEFLGKNKIAEPDGESGDRLYRALLVGDIPSAWLIVRPMLEKSKAEKRHYSVSFNCGLCLFLLEEYEKALVELKRAEQDIGNPPDIDTSERKLFIKAFCVTGGGSLPPLDNGGSPAQGRCALIRVRQLMAMCLIKLERRQEAAPIQRFLAQYNIEI